MREKFIDKEFGKDAIAVISWVNAALTEYERKGYQASLRQVFYHGVSNMLLRNSESEYSRLGDIVTDGRMAGLIDWDMIVDRNRQMVDHQYWENPKDLLKQTVETFRTNKWLDQDCYVEVFAEKAALEGILIPVCNKYEVPFLSCRGFASASVAYEAGKRMQERFHAGKSVHVIALFDHDPSGISMSEDLARRLALFSQVPVNLHRVALNMDQIEKFNPPPNPVKFKDSRATGYEARFGQHCWELDSLPVDELVNITTNAILAFRDEGRWEASFEKQEELREFYADLI